MNGSDDAKVLRVRETLLSWFALNRRDLPWRLTRDPYAILVSEVMLQQTQVNRVLPYFDRWMRDYPTVNALAIAPTSDVIRAWSGLGYNRRAVNLQRTARAVVDQFDGVFPQDAATLQTLSGIGPYTAGALCAFAFEQDVAFLDTNMRRVLHRLFAGSDYPQRTVGDTQLTDIGLELISEGHGWVINQALIEFGALVCTQRRPACVICPLQTDCCAYPAIQSAIADVPRGVRLKDEGVFEGSNRQFRGRVVDALRQSHPVRLEDLGADVRPGFTANDLPWIYGVVEGLVRDGLVAIAESGEEYDASSPDPDVLISLPD